MSEIGDTFKAVKKLDDADKQRCRDDAASTWRNAARVASENGMRLIQIDPSHYQLSNGWLINLYPGNQRVYMDRNRPRAPYLQMPVDRDWTLMDAVLAAVGIMN